MKNLLLFLLMALFLSACSPKSIYGTYHTDGEGVMMVGYTYGFFPDSTFFVHYWSDDLSSYKQGSGTYELRGRQLKLNYTEYDASEASYDWRPMEEMDDGKTHYQFVVVGANARYLGGVMVQLLDADGQAITQGVTDANGEFQATITKTISAKRIEFSYIGMKPFAIVPDNRMSSYFRVDLIPVITYIPAGTVETLRVKSTYHYLQFRDGTRKWRVRKEMKGDY